MATHTLTPPSRIGSGSPPPVQGKEHGGGGSKWVELVKAANDIEAHLLSGRLAEAGVEVSVLKDRSAPGAWLYGGSNPWAPVAVMVKQLQLSEARLVLAEIAFDGPALSTREAPLRNWRTPVLWWSVALGLGLLLTGVALGRTAGALDRCELPLLCADPVSGR